MRYKVILLSVSLIFSNCTKHEKYDPKRNKEQAKELHNKSMKRFQDYLLTPGIDISSSSIIDTLDQAIALYPSMPTFYYSKSIVYKAFGNLNASIEVLEELFQTDSTQIQTLFLSGNYYEIQNNKVIADSLYSLAVSKYESLIQYNEYDEVLIEEWAYANTFLNGKESTIAQLSKYSNLGENYLRYLTNEISNFDREEYLISLVP